jgi:glycosyltransferase involved in cell wall biosynthesis
MDSPRPLRIALLSYRSKVHVGGQGVYVRQLSRELTALGHRVEVFSGPPYPELDPGVLLQKVPSLDLYRNNVIQNPHPREVRSPVDALEVAIMWSAGFPEPLTFSLRAGGLLKQRLGEFDIVHDNQSLGYGLLGVQRAGLPVMATIHHPISIDRKIELATATGWRRLSLRRWYGFTRMQAKVARRLPAIVTVSEASAEDIAADFGVSLERIQVVPNGVDTRVFTPGKRRREPSSLIAIASADVPLKGIGILLKAVAKIAETRSNINLMVVGAVCEDGPTAQLLNQLQVGKRVNFVSNISDEEKIRLLQSRQLAVVPSLYEGFSLPAVEAMACATPVVASRAAALPEVVGDDGQCATLVAPGDAEELAAAITDLLDNPEKCRRMGQAGRQRVCERFAWSEVAAQTIRAYQALLTVTQPAAAHQENYKGRHAHR